MGTRLLGCILAWALMAGVVCAAAAPAPATTKLPNGWTLQELVLCPGHSDLAGPSVDLADAPAVNHKGTVLWWVESKVARTEPDPEVWYEGSDLELVRMDLVTGETLRVRASPKCWMIRPAGVDQAGNLYAVSSKTPCLQRKRSPFPERGNGPPETEFVRIDSTGRENLLLNGVDYGKTYPYPDGGVSEDGHSLIHSPEGIYRCSPLGELELIPGSQSLRLAQIAPNGDVYFWGGLGGVGVLRNNTRVTLIPEPADHLAGFFKVNGNGEAVCSFISQAAVYTGGRVIFIKPAEAAQFKVIYAYVGIDDQGDVFLTTDHGTWFCDAQKRELTALVIPLSTSIGPRVVGNIVWFNQNIDAAGNLYAWLQYKSGESAIVRISRGTPIPLPRNPPTAAAVTDRNSPDETAESVIFRSGDRITGRITSLGADGLLRMIVPGPERELALPVAELQQANFTPTAMEADPHLVLLTNGDRVAGTVASVTATQVIVESSAAGKLTIDRPSVRSIRFHSVKSRFGPLRADFESGKTDPFQRVSGPLNWLAVTHAQDKGVTVQADLVENGSPTACSISFFVTDSSFLDENSVTVSWSGSDFLISGGDVPRGFGLISGGDAPWGFESRVSRDMLCDMLGNENLRTLRFNFDPVTRRGALRLNEGLDIPVGSAISGSGQAGPGRVGRHIVIRYGGAMPLSLFQVIEAEDDTNHEIVLLGDGDHLSADDVTLTGGQLNVKAEAGEFPILLKNVGSVTFRSSARKTPAANPQAFRVRTARTTLTFDSVEFDNQALTGRAAQLGGAARIERAALQSVVFTPAAQTMTGPEPAPGASLTLINGKAADADLAVLKDRQDVRGLDLSASHVTDAGLANLKDLKGLQMLDLAGTQVTDAGLVQLSEMTGLQMLALQGTQVTDAGLANLKGLKSLQMLDLTGTQVTDAGLVQLKEMTGLQTLALNNTHVTDAGLANLKEMKGLRMLLLWNTLVTDAGMTDLREMASLQTLDLGHTRVTDAGVANLKGMQSLKMLLLHDTQVTDAGVADLKAALPNTQIYRYK